MTDDDALIAKMWDAWREYTSPDKRQAMAAVLAVVREHDRHEDGCSCPKCKPVCPACETEWS